MDTVSRAFDSVNLLCQGSLVKLSMSGGSGRSGPSDDHWRRRGYQQVWDEWSRRYSHRERYWIPAEGGQAPVSAVAFTPAELEQIETEAQARALALKRAYYKRGSITGFSARSRKRLIETAARLSDDVRGVFLTLTYSSNMQDHIESKRHLDLLLRFVKYHWPEVAWIWRLEYQERGAIHYHLVGLGRDFVPIAKVRAHWWRVTGERARCHVSRLENKRKALYYVSKYICKLPEVVNFINEPYSEKQGWRGRFWGVVNRKMMPWASAVVYEYTGLLRPVMQFRRAARRHWHGCGRGRVQGFTLFSADVARWGDYWRLLLETYHDGG